MTAAAPTLALSLRPAGSTDDEFLRAVYASTRADELALVDWSDEVKHEFLRHQFDAQTAHYRTHYAGASFDVIELDGEAVGRLYVARWQDEIRIIDVAVTPEHRGLGIATQLLRELLAEAATCGKRVSIHVELNNPALRLYERLGFAPVAQTGIYLRLEATP